MKIFLILQGIITAILCRVNMEEAAKITRSLATYAIAKIIILEKIAMVSILAMVYAFKIYFHNHLLDRSVLYLA